MTWPCRAVLCPELSKAHLETFFLLEKIQYRLNLRPHPPELVHIKSLKKRFPDMGVFGDASIEGVVLESSRCSAHGQSPLRFL